jgi:hypothetical protein
VVIAPRPRRQLAGVHPAALLRQKAVHHVGHGPRLVVGGPRLAAGFEVLADADVLLQCRVAVLAEVVEATVDLLAPLAAGVQPQRELVLSLPGRHDEGVPRVRPVRQSVRGDRVYERVYSVDGGSRGEVRFPGFSRC